MNNSILALAAALCSSYAAFGQEITGPGDAPIQVVSHPTAPATQFLQTNAGWQALANQPGALLFTDTKTKRGAVLGNVTHQDLGSGAWVQNDPSLSSTNNGWRIDGTANQILIQKSGSSQNVVTQTYTDYATKYNSVLALTLPALTYSGGLRLNFTQSGLPWTLVFDQTGAFRIESVVAKQQGKATYSFPVSSSEPLTIDSAGELFGNIHAGLTRAVMIPRYGKAIPCTAWSYAKSGIASFTCDDSALKANQFPYRIDPQSQTLTDPGTYNISSYCQYDEPDSEYDCGGNDAYVSFNFSSYVPSGATGFTVSAWGANVDDTDMSDGDGDDDGDTVGWTLEQGYSVSNVTIDVGIQTNYANNSCGGCDPDYSDSATISSVYATATWTPPPPPPTVATPTFSPGAGTYTSAQSVSISTSTYGATVRYTTDQSAPTETHGSVYNNVAIPVSATETIDAIAYESGWTDSSVASAAFIITGTVATPTFSPAAGTYTTAQSVTLSTSTSGATIRYTTDGSAPTETHGAVYSSVIPVSTTTTIKAIAYKSTWADSVVASATYTITPTIGAPSPNSGPVGTSVTISGTNLGASPGSVTFNGTAATPTSWSTTGIVVTVPAGATTGNVVVTVSGVATNGVTFTVLPTPAITGISPTSGPIGASVTIAGTNFGSSQGSSTVTFNGAAASTSWSATSIVATVPAGATTGNVVVTVNAVPSNGMNFIVAAPSLSITSAHTGSFAQGQTTGAAYSLTVTNSGTGATSGTVSVTDTLPSGLTLASMSGTGWACSGATCSRSDSLAGGGSSGWYNNSWAHRKPITISHAQVSGSSALTNFPVLISLPSDANLRAEALASGADILFTDSTGTVKLNHEIEQYASSSGQLVAWVQIPSLSPTADTAIYMYYGNPSASNQQSIAAVWDSTYRAVWHLPNGMTLSANDSTGNANNGTSNGATAAAGEIGGAASLNGSTNYIGAGTAITSNTFTVSAWIYLRAFQAGCEAGGIFYQGTGYYDLGTHFTIESNCLGYVNTITARYEGSAYVGAANNSIQLNTWQHVVFTYNAGAATFYVNGVALGSASGLGTQAPVANPSAIGYWYNTADTSRFFNGLIDEMEISGVVRTAGWLGTEYNNQSSPGTFFTLSAEQEASVSYPQIAVTVNVATNAAPQVTNSVSVSGGGSAGASATDSTAIVQIAPSLSVSSTHTGNFAQGQTGAMYTVTVSNSGNAPTSGMVTVTESLTGGLTLASMIDSNPTSGAYWTCSGGASSGSCSRSDSIGAAGSSAWYSGSWTHRKSIAISHAQVSGSSSLTNFPVLISLPSDANLQAEAQTNGADILFTDSTGTVKLNHEIEQYASSSGQLVAWVQIPSLSPTADTVIYMFYGNASASNQQNASAVWSAGYRGVWHLSGASALSLADSTANGNTLTKVGSVTVAPAQIAGGASFPGYYGNHLIAPNNTGLAPAQLSVSCWFQTPVSSAWQYAIDSNGDSNGFTFQLAPNDGGYYVTLGNVYTNIYSSKAFGGGAHYFTATYDGSTVRTYIDGVPDISQAISGSPAIQWPANGPSFGSAYSGAYAFGYSGGLLEEVRWSPAALASGWIATEYNNQKSPGTFFTLSAEQAPATSYSAITVTVKVAPNASSPQTNTVTVSGGGAATASASDSTIIVPPSSLTISSAHTASFVQGQNGTYTLTVSNQSGAGPTTGTVMATETAPAGMTLLSMAGSGWNCTSNPCTRSDVLNPGYSYPAITATVNVAPGTPSPETNQVSVSGGGSPTNTGGDSTIVLVPDFTISLTPSSSPATATTMVGGQATFNVALSSINSFNGVVTLTAPGLPTGASATFSPASICLGPTGTSCGTVAATPSSTSTIMNVTAPSWTGPMSVGVVGSTPNGSLSHAAASVLAVQDFTIAMSPIYPVPVTVAPGAEATWTVFTSGLNGFGQQGQTIGLQFIPIAYGNSAACQSLGNVIWSAPTIAPGQPDMLTVTAGPANQYSCSFEVVATSGSARHVLYGYLTQQGTGNIVLTQPLQQTVSAGQTATFPAPYTPTGGFNGTVAYSVSGQVPSGAAPAFTAFQPPQLGDYLSVPVPPGTPAATYGLTITAASPAGCTPGNSGCVSQSVLAPLKVQSGQGFSITATPTSPQPVAPGGTATYNVTVNSTGGYTGTVSLSASGGPPGSSVALTSYSVQAGGSVTMTVSVPNYATANPYSVGVTATNGSVTLNSSSTLTVSAAAAANVISPMPGGLSISSGSTLFTWNNGIGASQYGLNIGSSAGGSNYFSGSNLGSAACTDSSAPPNTPHCIRVTIPGNASAAYTTLISYTPNGSGLTQSYVYSIQTAPTTISIGTIVARRNGVPTTVNSNLSGDTVSGCGAPIGVLSTQNSSSQTISFTASGSAQAGTTTVTCSTAQGKTLTAQFVLSGPFTGPVTVTPQGGGSFLVDIPIYGTAFVSDVLFNGAEVSYSTQTGAGEVDVIFATGLPCSYNYTADIQTIDPDDDDPNDYYDDSIANVYLPCAAPPPALQVSTSPAKVVAGYGSQFSVTATASGGSGSGYTYSWTIVSVQAGDNTGIAQFCNAQGACSQSQQGPSCVGQTTCAATLQGVAGGKATLEVSVSDSAGDQAQTPAQTRLIVVSFSQLTVTASASVSGSPPTQTNAPPQTACFSTQPTQPPQLSCFSPQPLTAGPLQWPGPSDTAWLTTVTPLVFVENSTPTISVSATTTPAATDPDVTITFGIVRAPDDTSGATCQQNLPSVASLGSGVATVALNQCGSFQVLAFIDTNGNGTRDNNDTGIAFPLIIVEAQLYSYSSTPNPETQDILGGGPGSSAATIISGSSPNLATPQTSAVSLLAAVTFVGGGGLGLRGTERVFAAWAQNEESQNDVGTYGTAPSQLRFIWEPLSNPGATTTFYASAPEFLPTTGVTAVPQPLPLLDAQPGAFPNGLAGGNTPSLGPGQYRQTLVPTPYAIGSQFQVLGIDSPSASFPLAHPADTNAPLVQCQQIDSFDAFLIVWSSSAINNSGGTPTGTSAPTGTLPDSLYSALAMQPWGVSATYSISANNPPSDVGQPTTTLDPTQAITFPSAVPLASLNPFAPVLVPPILVVILGVNAQQ